MQIIFISLTALVQLVYILYCLLLSIYRVRKEKKNNSQRFSNPNVKFEISKSKIHTINMNMNWWEKVSYR